MTPNEKAELVKLKHQHWLEAANELLRFDETELALKLLDTMPALYRDYPIPEIADLKRDIIASIVTPHAYMTACYDQDVNLEMAKSIIQNVLRAKILVKEVEACKDAPHIVDVGPGEYWVPIGLEYLGHIFTYNPIAMDQVAAKKAEGLINTVLFKHKPASHVPTIFVAHEIIEHLHNPIDLVAEALRHCGRWPDFVHLSTPLYTYDCAEKDWRDAKTALPHLRAYTPREFIKQASDLFPGYNWEYKTDAVQSLRGYKTGTTLLEDLK